MAQAGPLKRGLDSLRNGLRAIRTGEGEGTAAQIGRGARRGLARARDKLKFLGSKLGLWGTVDEIEDEDEERRRRRRRQVLGYDPAALPAASLTGQGAIDKRASPELRAQLSAGMASARSHTRGSTSVDFPSVDPEGEG